MGIMEGPFVLTIKNIGLIKNKPGIYILGKKGLNNKYYGCYVRRSDDDISGRIAYWFNLIEEKQPHRNESERCIIQENPTYYWREYTDTAREAYNLECKIWHDNRYICNDIHPSKTYSSWVCPVCEQ